jgi:hypothetical protein
MHKGHIGYIGYPGQFGANNHVCHIGNIEYFGLRNISVDHFTNAVPFHGDILLVRTPSKGIMKLFFSEVIFITVWSIYALLRRGRGNVALEQCFRA